MTNQPIAVESGYAPTAGPAVYYESYGSGGVPVILLHGGFGSTAMLGQLAGKLAVDRRVIAVDLQGHGRTKDVDRPLRYQDMGDDIASVIDHLGLGQADVVGYSLGGGTALRTAIQHPEKVRKVVVTSSPFSFEGWYPGVRAGMAQVSSAGFEMIRQTPMYAAYAAVAPDVDAFPTLMDKMGDLLTQPYDWSAEVSGLTMPTMLIFGDSDSVPATYIAQFHALLGGGQQDAGWDRSGMARTRLAILPNTTHYEIFDKPELHALVAAFLDE